MASGKDAFRTLPLGGVWGMPIWQGAQRQTGDMMEGLYLPAGLGMLRHSPEDFVDVEKREREMDGLLCRGCSRCDLSLKGYTNFSTQ